MCSLDSGFKLDPDAFDRVDDMKIGSKSTRYFIFRLSKDDSMVHIEKEVKKTDLDQEKDFDELMSSLTEEEGRFIVLDLSVKRLTGASTDQMYFITWNPDNSHIGHKTLYSSTCKTVTTMLNLKSVISIQANDYDDISYSLLMEKALR